MPHLAQLNFGSLRKGNFGKTAESKETAEIKEAWWRVASDANLKKIYHF
jgi:ribosomal protein S19E (S16A)